MPTFEINFFQDPTTEMSTEEIDGNNMHDDLKMEPQPQKQSQGELLLYLVLISILCK